MLHRRNYGRTQNILKQDTNGWNYKTQARTAQKLLLSHFSRPVAYDIQPACLWQKKLRWCPRDPQPWTSIRIPPGHQTQSQAGKWGENKTGLKHWTFIQTNGLYKIILTAKIWGNSSFPSQIVLEVRGTRLYQALKTNSVLWLLLGRYAHVRPKNCFCPSLEKQWACWVDLPENEKGVTHKNMDDSKTAVAPNGLALADNSTTGSLELSVLQTATLKISTLSWANVKGSLTGPAQPTWHWQVFVFFPFLFLANQLRLHSLG